MKNYKISMVEERTEFGHDQSDESIMYVVKWTMHDDIRLSFSNDFRGVPKDAYELVATITFTHPFIMWGTPEEVRESFYFAAKRLLEKQPEVQTNDCGTMFWIA